MPQLLLEMLIVGIGLMTSSGSGAGAAAHFTTVRVEGAVTYSGSHPSPKSGRLSGAIEAAQPTPVAYALGSSFQRQEARAEQLRLRAGLEHDLRTLAATVPPDALPQVEVLQQYIGNAQVTGRVTQRMDAAFLKVQPAFDPVLAPGDTIFIPERPTTVVVLGAVEGTCRLPHQPLKDVKQYLHGCPAAQSADLDVVYVIQPDGVVRKHGVAPWNRSDPQAIAPGGLIYVPLSEKVLGGLDPGFNEQFAAFVATQPVHP